MKKWGRGSRYGTYRTEVGDEEAGRAIITVWTHEPGPERGIVVPWPEGEANLNLVLAVPEMLAALEINLRLLRKWQAHLEVYDPTLESDDVIRAIKQTRTAIAKAKGETHEV